MKEFKIDALDSNGEKCLMEKLPFDYYEEKAVLGFDIYKYSQYTLIQQFYIPVAFDAIYMNTVKNVLENEDFFFSQYGSKLSDFQINFISSGDGGFQIFDNPIQCIVFAIYFQANINGFITGSSSTSHGKKVHAIIDTIDLRYAITLNSIYSFKSNFYGPGIINNARILSKDRLNRLLIDSNTMKWFLNNINSVENLLDINKDSFLLTNAFKDYDNKLNSTLFGTRNTFKAIDALKIGSIKVKDSLLNIYNLHIQAMLQLTIGKHAYNNFIVTVGNLNTSGIE